MASRTATSHTAPYSSSYIATFSSERTGSRRPRGYPKPLGRGNGFPVVEDGRFVRQRHSALIIEQRQSRSSSRGNGYTVQREHGRKQFTVIDKHSTLHDVKTLKERSAFRPVPVLEMRDKLLSVRSTVVVRDAKHTTLLLLQKASVINVKKKVVNGYIKGKTTTTPDLVITGSSSGRKFVLRDRRSNEVARLVRQRSSKQRGSLKHVRYRLSVNAGYDTAFFSMCAIYLVELWGD